MKRKMSVNLQPIKLPEPVFGQCNTLFEALKKRRTCRSLSDKNIPLQILSDILWAAQGVNRTDGPFGDTGRTAGSASNSQEISIYVAKVEGVYLYEPDSHIITPITDVDIRTLAIGPRQKISGTNAPVRLIYVTDIDKLKNAPLQEPGLFDAAVQKSYYFVDTGLIAQNVYLAAAALGLVSWFHNCNKVDLKKVLSLKPNQRPLFGHTIGYAGE